MDEIFISILVVFFHQVFVFTNIMFNAGSFSIREMRSCYYLKYQRFLIETCKIKLGQTYILVLAYFV